MVQRAEDPILRGLRSHDDLFPFTKLSVVNKLALMLAYILWCTGYIAAFIRKFEAIICKCNDKQVRHTIR